MDSDAIDAPVLVDKQKIEYISSIGTHVSVNSKDMSIAMADWDE